MFCYKRCKATRLSRVFRWKGRSGCAATFSRSPVPVWEDAIAKRCCQADRKAVEASEGVRSRGWLWLHIGTGAIAQALLPSRSPVQEINL